MKNLRRILAVAAVATAVSSSSAFALTTTLDFGNFTGGGSFPGSSQTSVTGWSYNVFPGVTLQLSPEYTNSARVIQPHNLTDPSILTRTRNLPTGHPNEVNSGGIGELKSSHESIHDINGALTYGDLVKFTFSHAVKLVSIRFSRVDSNDVFDFWNNSVYQFTAPTPTPAGQYVFAPFTFGSIFDFGTIKLGSDYKIRSITVSSVPLPPAALLFVTGLFGVGALGRRRSKAQ
jgi:hypothetical protein